MYSHPALVVHLTVLFNIVLAYSFVPDAFGKDIINEMQAMMTQFRLIVRLI